MRRLLATWVFLFVSCGFGAACTGARASESAALHIEVETAAPLQLTESALAKLPRQSLRVKDHDGAEATFEGVPLVEVLKAAGVRFGEELKGPRLASYLVVEAADGYRVVFALPELDPSSTDRVILLADRRDGKPLSAKEGPWRVVVPGEKKFSRWVRQVVRLKVRKA
jgi:DMSO/TMAO reductase YedYZ molybdopterin-dependent catalytic subunit